MVSNSMTGWLRTRRRRRAASRGKIGGAVGVLVCVTALLGSASAFAAAHTTDQVRRSAPEIHIPAPHCHGCTATGGSGSSNWSGYAQTGSGFSSISATWTVPTVSSSGGTATDSSTWIGIDGANNTSLIQTGVEQGWNGSGPFYQAWWEILPASETVKFNVSPGDTIAASIKKLNGTQWSIYLIDRNSNQTINVVENYSGPQTSAEFIHEAPTINNSVVPLSNDSPVYFYNARVNGFSPGLKTSQSITMVQNGQLVSTPSVPNAATNGFDVNHGGTALNPPGSPLAQDHNDGSVWVSTGPACNNSGCPGWREIDNNANEFQIAAGAGSVFERHNDGSIWEWAGAACGSTCAGWVELDNNPASTDIEAGAGSLWQLHSDGSIWRSTGEPCENRSCPGWVELDDNPATTHIVAGAGTLFQRHDDGSIWRWTGAACVNGSCPGWIELDSNPSTIEITAGSATVFQLHSDGSIWRSTGAPCGPNGCLGWTEIDNNPATSEIESGGATVYQLHNNGSLWQYTGTPCSGGSCTGWRELDNNPATLAIVASAGTVFELHSTTRSIWRWTGAPCSGGACAGWVELDGNSNTQNIAVSNGS